MKVVILAGGLGTRLAEETEIRPKPMVEIGGQPILWHIMKHYAFYGFREFFIALGYRGEVIKRYFLDYYHNTKGSMTVSLDCGKVTVEDRSSSDDWIVHLEETGLKTATGGRVKRLQAKLGRHPFLLTYGDGVCSINLRELICFHQRQGCSATLTAVRPPARFGGLVFKDGKVVAFTEKPQIGEGWINGGFMVLEPEIFDYLVDDDSILERDALEKLASKGKLGAYPHEGFWQCMDTIRDKNLLENLWRAREAPWKTW